MRPHIEDGTIVMLDPVRRPLALYDVVLACRDGHVILHRVMHLSSDHVWLMGDAHRHAEGPLPIARVFGIARLEAPRGLWRWRMKLRRGLFLVRSLLMRGQS